MKNNKILIGVVVGVMLLGLAGGYFVLSQKSSSPSSPQQEDVQEVIPTLTPQEVGLEFILRPDKKAAKFSLSKITNIELVEYEITYSKEIEGEEIPEALIGEVKVREGEKKIEIDYRDFGTCSSGVCRYDKVISEVKLLLKITKNDGKIYSVEDILKL